MAQDNEQRQWKLIRETKANQVWNDAGAFVFYHEMSKHISMYEMLGNEIGDNMKKFMLNTDKSKHLEFFKLPMRG